MITVENLTNYARKFLREEYSILLEIPIVRNNRLSRAMGRYVQSYRGEPKRIEMAGFMFEYSTDEIMYDTLRHELIHHALHVMNRPFSDGEPEFEEELKIHNATSTGVHTVGKFNILSCNDCGTKTESDKKKYIQKITQLRCSHCEGTISHDGHVIYTGESRNVYIKERSV